jgi:hypothetical protein
VRTAHNQPVITPEVLACPCGSSARPIDWDFRDSWKVYCEKNCTSPLGECLTRHRAVCRWNNLVRLSPDRITKQPTADAGKGEM